jgi:hypothetical protein
MPACCFRIRAAANRKTVLDMASACASFFIGSIARYPQISMSSASLPVSNEEQVESITTFPILGNSDIFL